MPMDFERLGPRLLAGRTITPVDDADVSGFLAKVAAALQLATQPVAFMLDLRYCPIFPDHVMNTFVASLKRDNPHVGASAWLLGNNRGTVALQVSRAIRDANNPSR